MTTKNPWRGLASYEEPQGTSDDYKFCGRDDETMDAVRLIDNNLFITLYGSSGIGKTSLLKAGVMPILKRRGYHPIYLRLSQEPTETSYAEAIVRRLQNSGLREERSVEIEHTDSNDRLYLWNYFAVTRFLDNEGSEVYPVLILDQFEEVFRDADKAKAELLLQQIYLLLNDELEMPDLEGYSADTNYRFVASIREDFLFVLEDSIDGLSLDLLKNNRYRLRPMKPENARQVVMVPGKDCIDVESQAEIADQVVAMAERNSYNSIDTLLLSLICSEMYNVAEQNQSIISQSLIEQLGDNILASFYKRTMSDVSPKTADYLETHLLTQSGYRNSIALEDMLHEGIDKEDIDQLIEKRLLRVEHSRGIERIEFTHDALCAMAKNSRDLHFERQRRQGKVAHSIGFFFDTAIPLLFTIAVLKFSIDISSDTLLFAIPINFILIALTSILLPYRHTRERNTLWCSIINIVFLQITLLFYIVIASQKEDLVLSFYPFIFIHLILLVYNVVLFVLSLGFKKIRGIKETLKYIFTFKIYREYPSFIIILPILLVVTLLLSAFFIAPAITGLLQS